MLVLRGQVWGEQVASLLQEAVDAQFRLGPLEVGLVGASELYDQHSERSSMRLGEEPARLRPSLVFSVSSCGLQLLAELVWLPLLPVEGQLRVARDMLPLPRRSVEQ